MKKEYEDWNEKNYPLKIIDIKEEKSIDRTWNFTKTISFFVLIIITLGFLSVFVIRTYYFDFFRDIVETSNICNPIQNITIQKQCGDTIVDCHCLTPDELEDVLKNVCPDKINIYINSS